tara:strand:- start:764 stop:1171 length:408 start_codon:yes stop_codon:yes gene_type:complete
VLIKKTFFFGFFLVFLGFSGVLLVDCKERCHRNIAVQKPHFIRLKIKPDGIRDLWLIPLSVPVIEAIAGFSQTRQPGPAIHTPKQETWVSMVAVTILHVTEMVGTTVDMGFTPHHLVVNDSPSILESFLHLQLGA